MADLRASIAEFLDELRDSGPLWRSIDMRVIAIRRPDGWSNLVTRCLLDARAPEDVPRIPAPLETTHILAVQSVRPVEELGEVLGALAVGEIESCGRAVSYRTGEAGGEGQPDAPAAQPYTWGHTGFLERSTPYAIRDHAWSALTFSVTGDSIQSFLRHVPGDWRGLDREIRTCAEPYDGLAGLAKHFAREPDQLGSSHGTHFEVYAPFEVRFAREASGLGEVLKVGMTVGSTAAASASRLGYFAASTDGLPTPGTLDLSEVPSAEGGSDVVVASFPAPAAGAVTLFLNIGLHCVDTLTLIRLPAHGPNPRIEAYRTVDPDLDYFRSGFFPAIRSDSKIFEQAAARLFTFLGFSVDILGPDKKISEGADFLAYSNGLILPIECTTGSIDANGKLGKLFARAQAIAADANCEVFAVLATSLHRKRIASQEMSKAAADGIAVLAREDLDHLFQLALGNVSPESAMEFVLARVPTPPAEPLSGLFKRR